MKGGRLGRTNLGEVVGQCSQVGEVNFGRASSR